MRKRMTKKKYNNYETEGYIERLRKDGVEFEDLEYVVDMVLTLYKGECRLSRNDQLRTLEHY